MIKILIQGIKDGEYDIHLEIPAREIEDLYEVFTGNILLEGMMRKLGNRFSFTGEARCNTLLVCDRSLKEFEQLIIAEISISFLADNSLFRANKGELSDSREVIIHEDDKYIDLTQEVREQLAVKLPMKRISPEFADKEFEDLFPEYAASKNDEFYDEESDERWAPLKEIKLN